MNNAPLVTNEVTRIVLMASMTPVGEMLSPCTEELDRKKAGFLDVGWHYLVGRDGSTYEGVPNYLRGNLLPRYSRTSITIKVVGGLNHHGEPSNNFTPAQMTTVRQLMDTCLNLYPNATPALHRDLFRGSNPVFSHKDYQNA